MASRNLPYGGGAVPMDAGERNRRVTIEQLSSSTGSTRFPVESWSTLVVGWAKRQDQTMRERFANPEVLAAKVGVRWEIGYRADCDPELVDVPATRRLVWEGTIFDIVGASVIGAREGIEFQTIARSAAGE